MHANYVCIYKVKWKVTEMCALTSPVLWQMNDNLIRNDSGAPRSTQHVCTKPIPPHPCSAGHPVFADMRCPRGGYWSGAAAPQVQADAECEGMELWGSLRLVWLGGVLQVQPSFFSCWLPVCLLLVGVYLWITPCPLVCTLLSSCSYASLLNKHLSRKRFVAQLQKRHLCP